MAIKPKVRFSNVLDVSFTLLLGRNSRLIPLTTYKCLTLWGLLFPSNKQNAREGLVNFYVFNHDDWDVTILVIIWAYHTIPLKLKKYTTFILFYGKEDIFLVEFIIPSLLTTQDTKVLEEGSFYGAKGWYIPR